MIVLDTNVIYELWKAAPDPSVLVWVDAQMVETLYLSAITVAALRFGLAAGRVIGRADGYIAATAATRGLVVATHDTSPFEAAGLNIINPWETRADER
jgi:toxin FitB